MTPSREVDWETIKLAYINSSKSLREIAQAFGIKASPMMRRAAREKWRDERRQQAQKVSKTAQQALTFDRAEALAKWNAEDLQAARALKAKAAAHLRDALTPVDLRTVAGVFVAARELAMAALAVKDNEDKQDNMPPVQVVIQRVSARKDGAGAEAE